MPIRRFTPALLVALLGGAFGIPRARAADIFVRGRDGRLCLTGNALSRGFGQNVALALQGRYQLHSTRPWRRVIAWMDKLPRSLVAPDRPDADSLRVLSGKPRMSNPVDLLSLLGHAARDIPRGGRILELGTGLYSSALLVGLAADARAQLTVIDIDAHVAGLARATIRRLLAGKKLPAGSIWQVLEGGAAAMALGARRFEPFDRIVFGFGVSPAQSDVVQRMCGRLLKPEGKLVVPFQEKLEIQGLQGHQLQRLYVGDASGNLAPTPSHVSFETGQLD